MSDVRWPDPAPEPDTEPGEDLDSHLLPNLHRLRTMTPEQRQDLLDRVRDWVGERVEQFRERVRSL